MTFEVMQCFVKSKDGKLLLYHSGRTFPCCVRPENKLEGSTFIVSKIDFVKMSALKILET